MKPIGIVLFVLSACLMGCSGDPKADPAKDEALKASFSKKPDINTLSPKMRNMVEGMMASSKNGKPPTNAVPPPPPK